MPITGQGLGLRWQNAAKSSASSPGRMQTLPWTYSEAIGVCQLARLTTRSQPGKPLRPLTRSLHDFRSCPLWGCAPCERVSAREVREADRTPGKLEVFRLRGRSSPNVEQRSGE